MDVILLDKVDNLGNLGDKVSVKAGFGRNFLIPSGRAVPATGENLATFEARRAELEKQAAEKLAAAEARKAQIEGLGKITITHKAGDDGKLFGSVGTNDIADACTTAGAEVSKAEVRLPEGPLRVVGEYEVGLHLHADVDASISVEVAAEA